MFALSASVLTIALSLAGRAVAQLPKPVLFTDGLSPHVDAVLSGVAPANITSFVSRTYGTLPQFCLDAAHGEGLFGWDIEVYEVTYADCPIKPWVFCRHHAAQLSQTTMADLFGRIPVHEREWVRHVVALPGGGSAYASGADVVFIGNTNAVSVFQHEIGHVMDFQAHGGVLSSTSTAFTNAITSDSCVPDDYANSNQIEDYAQVSVLALYDIVATGGLNSIGANWTCLQNQKTVLDNFQRAQMVYGGTCSRYWNESPSVPAQQRARSARRAVTADENEPKPYRSATTVFKNLVHGLD